MRYRASPVLFHTVPRHCEERSDEAIQQWHLNTTAVDNKFLVSANPFE